MFSKEDVSQGVINPFSPNVPLMDIPGSWFLLAVFQITGPLVENGLSNGKTIEVPEEMVSNQNSSELLKSLVLENIQRNSTENNYCYPKTRKTKRVQNFRPITLLLMLRKILAIFLEKQIQPKIKTEIRPS